MPIMKKSEQTKDIVTPSRYVNDGTRTVSLDGLRTVCKESHGNTHYVKVEYVPTNNSPSVFTVAYSDVATRNAMYDMIVRNLNVVEDFS